MKKIIISLILILTITFAACSSSNESEGKNTQIEVQKEEGDKSEEQIQQEKLLLLIDDGIYSEEFSYINPKNLTDKVNLNMEIKDEVIVLLNLEVIEAHEFSQKHIANVNEELQTLAVGKKISEVEFPQVIAGASLTSKAFKEKLSELSKS